MQTLHTNNKTVVQTHKNSHKDTNKRQNKPKKIYLKVQEHFYKNQSKTNTNINIESK